MPCALWADNTNPVGDRRHIISMGPFNLNAKQSTELEFAYVWAVDSSVVNGNIASATKLISENQKVRSFYYSKTPTTCLPILTVPGIQENSLLNSLLIYPNPANGILNVKWEMLNGKNTHLKIKNVLGQVLLSQTTDIQHSTLNIQHLPSGVYFVTIEFNGQSAVKKFVKD